MFTTININLPTNVQNTSLHYNRRKISANALVNLQKRKTFSAVLNINLPMGTINKKPRQCKNPFYNVMG